MKKFFTEFKAFAVKGHVVNMAVGVMIGAAFQGVVTAFTEHLLSPVIGIFGGINFDALSWTIPGTEAVVAWGAFLTVVINFLITAMVIFLMVKGMNRLLEGEKKPEPPPTTKKCPFCKSEVDIEATRCKHCTSELEVVAEG